MAVISVVIPVYNVEAYLDECVQSVLSQSYADMELILVNDGSTDNSGAKCDEWVQNDPRIRVVHKENGGAADARNIGITHANGSYVLFLDGDDFWDDRNAVRRLMERVEKINTDVLNFSYKKYYEDTREKESYFRFTQAMPSHISRAEQLSYLTQHGLFIASPCNKLIKKSLLDKETILFRKGVYSEDIEWCARLMCHATSMDFVPEEFYCYRQRKNSVSHTINDKKCKDLHDNILRCFELSETISQDIRVPLLQYTAYQYGTFFAVQAQAENWQEDCLRSLQPYKWILRHHGGNRKVRLLHYCCSIIGYKNTCRLMRCVYRKR